jgi:hypothetical protein
MDLSGANENLKAFQAKYPQSDPVPISARTGAGISDLMAALGNWLD